jgi:DeoR/GlpR family transcriptional regulator of sugar metabolism
VPVLNLLAERTAGPRLIALGGELRADRHAFVGPGAEAALADLHVRLFFLEPAAVDARGTYAGSPAEASLQRALIDIADETVVMATPDVVASSAPALVAPLARVSWLVSDGPVPEELGAALRASGVATLPGEDPCPRD